MALRSLFLLFLIASIFGVSMSQAGAGAGPGPYSCTVEECPGKCGVRCSATHHPGNCLDTCISCCKRCLEVPPGVFGNKELTPCYNSILTKYGKPKCP